MSDFIAVTFKYTFKWLCSLTESTIYDLPSQCPQHTHCKNKSLLKYSTRFKNHAISTSTHIILL